MSTTSSELGPASRSSNWRTPVVIILCGCAIGMLGFGPRSALGFFVQPMSHEFAWGRDVFGLAHRLAEFALGIGQPIAGAVADRFGLFRVMCVGALLYAGGLLLMRYSSTPLSLELGAGVHGRLRSRRLLVQSGAVGVHASCCRPRSAASRSAPAPRRARSASSCSRRSASR